ncbi:MAG: Band 7 protein [Parcubacteria group bacterium GW2011_GWC1_43_30]|nr:MAG: Band 7 protein [Parcubacteria group bacterium GW2011_GWC1_43_30]
MTTNLWLVISFLSVWIILIVFIGLTPVKTGSIAVVFRFRRFVRIMQPGLNFRIPLIESVEYYSTQTHQEELPAEADMIDRVHDVAEAGKKLPFRVLMKGKGEAIFYIKKTETDNREEEVRKRIEDMASRTLQELLGPVTLGHAQEMMPLFSLLIRERIEILVGEKGEGDRPWGIHIRDAYIKSIHPGRRVNEARADAAASVSKKQEAIRVAEGVATATRLQADADAFSEQRKGEGEAARIGAMAVVMTDDNARFIATLDVAEQVLPKANLVVMPSDLGAIGGIIRLGQEIKK